MTVTNYPLKHIRLQQLYDSGFNVANFIHFPPCQLNTEALREFFNRFKVISCRHFHDDEKRFFKCPVIYEVSDWQRIVDFCSEHNRQFHTLCNEAVALKDAIFTGVILLIDDRDYVVEYFEGSGTPRDIETKASNELRVFSREIGKPLPKNAPPELMRVAARFHDFLPDQRPISLEFQIYPYPVGKLENTEIFWEWRLGWLHEPLELLLRLIQENEEMRITIQTLKKFQVL